MKFDDSERATLLCALTQYAVTAHDPSVAINCLDIVAPGPATPWVDFITEARTLNPALRKPPFSIEVASQVRGHETWMKSDLIDAFHAAEDRVEAAERLLSEWLTYTGLRHRAFNAAGLAADASEYVSGRSLVTRTDGWLAAEVPR